VIICLNSRVGANERTLITALARATIINAGGNGTDFEQAIQNAREALAFAPNYELLWEAMSKYGPLDSRFLSHCRLRYFVHGLDFGVPLAQSELIC
jgi:hypothetical protein